MKIKPAYITFEQSKWLKEKGFDAKVQSAFINKTFIEFEEKSSFDELTKYLDKGTDIVLAPEQWQVVEWLRINHGIWIQVTINVSNFGVKGHINEKFKVEVISQNRNVKFKSLISRTITEDGVLAPHNSPQEAYSAAFDYILTNNLI